MVDLTLFLLLSGYFLAGAACIFAVALGLYCNSLTKQRKRLKAEVRKLRVTNEHLELYYRAAWDLAKDYEGEINRMKADEQMWPREIEVNR